MNRNEYKAARRGYRLARREDAAWRLPDGRSYDLRQANDPKFQHPGNAARYLGQFPNALAATFLKPVPNHRGDLRLRTGPRSNAMRNAREVGGLNLPKRVALRSALRQIAALERAA